MAFILYLGLCCFNKVHGAEDRRKIIGGAEITAGRLGLVEDLPKCWHIDLDLVSAQVSSFPEPNRVLVEKFQSTRLDEMGGIRNV